MDYSKINHNKIMEEIQKHARDSFPDSEQNTSSKPTIKQVALEPQRDYSDLNNFAKKDANFHKHPHNLSPLPYQKQQHNESRDPKQVRNLTSTYLEAASFSKHINENLDISYKNPRNATPGELTILSKDDVSISIPDTCIAQNLKLEKQKNVEEYCSVPTPSANSLKEFSGDRLKVNGLTTSCDTNQFLQSSCHNEKPDKNPLKLITESPKNSNMVDDEETIEKIAEMIASSSNESNENTSPKTKKQLQILMSRSYTDPNWNISYENSLINDHNQVRIKNFQNQVNIDVTNDIYKAKASNTTNETAPLTNCKLASELVISPQSLKIVPESKAKQLIEGTEVKTPDKSRFEEVENKLEEMFAGIDDEQLMHPTNPKSNFHINTEKITNDFELENIKFVAITNENSEILQYVKPGGTLRDCYKNESFLLNNSSLPTKAAKKSTDSCILTTNKIKLPPEEETDVDAKKYLKSMPPRRRLSIGIDPSLLRISLESRTEISRKQKDIAHKDLLNENIIAKEIKNITKGSKIKANRSKNCTEKKREDNYLKPTNNKKKVLKTETHKVVPKQKQQKLKHRRMQFSLSFDNDNDHDERNHQRELDNKIRSPFVLIKHNGTITVMNAASSDDHNEKNTKVKKTGTYVHERKNVRGCHSSTLSNRYDAETADSTWICVFCKCGPHKKGLGDLFGPYIVSLDCDDYRSAVDIYTQDSTSILNKRKRTGSTLSTAICSDSLASSGKTTTTGASNTYMRKITNFIRTSAGRQSVPANYVEQMRSRSNKMSHIYKSAFMSLKLNQIK